MHIRTLKRIMPLIKSLIICMVLVGLVITAVGTDIFSPSEKVVAPVFNDTEDANISSWRDKIDASLWKSIIFSHLPTFGETIDTVSETKPLNLFLFFLTGVKLDEPLNYLENSVPTMAMVPIENQDEQNPDKIDEPPKLQPKKEKPEIENNLNSSLPLVAFYSTHSSETYELTDGMTHLKGKAGAIMKVGKKIAQKMNDKYEIPTIYSDKIHDTSFNKSYIESEKTVKNLIAENDSLRMLFDIHRDALLPRDNTKVKINGKECAKVLIVVGTDSRAKHPKWRENLAFAKKFLAKMDELYPGLSRGISIKNGRYNQQYHTSSLLLEVGSINNTTEEALNSASLLADVIVSLLNDLNESTAEK